MVTGAWRQFESRTVSAHVGGRIVRHSGSCGLDHPHGHKLDSLVINKDMVVVWVSVVVVVVPTAAAVCVCVCVCE